MNAHGGCKPTLTQPNGALCLYHITQSAPREARRTCHLQIIMQRYNEALRVIPACLEQNTLEGGCNFPAKHSGPAEPRSTYRR